MRAGDRVIIGWIDPGLVDGAFAAAIAILYAERRDRISGLARIEGGVIARQRNELVAMFLRTDAQWLLMIDADEQLSVPAFDLLVGAVHDKDRPIVAGLYFGAHRGDPYPIAIPQIYRDSDNGFYEPFTTYPPDRIIPVDAAGGGCLLVHRTVLEVVRAASNEPDWAWFRDGPVAGQWFSEDLFFCRQITNAGFPIHAHTGAILPHRKRLWLDDRHHERKADD